MDCNYACSKVFLKQEGSQSKTIYFRGGTIYLPITTAKVALLWYKKQQRRRVARGTPLALLERKIRSMNAIWDSDAFSNKRWGRWERGVLFHGEWKNGEGMKNEEAGPKITLHYFSERSLSIYNLLSAACLLCFTSVVRTTIAKFFWRQQASITQ